MRSKHNIILFTKFQSLTFNFIGTFYLVKNKNMLSFEVLKQIEIEGNFSVFPHYPLYRYYDNFTINVFIL